MVHVKFMNKSKPSNISSLRNLLFEGKKKQTKKSLSSGRKQTFLIASKISLQSGIFSHLPTCSPQLCHWLFTFQVIPSSASSILYSSCDLSYTFSFKLFRQMCLFLTCYYKQLCKWDKLLILFRNFVTLREKPKPNDSVPFCGEKYAFIVS